MSMTRFVPTPKFDDYKKLFKEHFKLERRGDGVVLAQAHTLDGPVQLSVENHRALGQLLKIIGADPENELLIITGTGDEFMMRIDPEGLARDERNSLIRALVAERRIWRPRQDSNLQPAA